MNIYLESMMFPDGKGFSPISISLTRAAASWLENLRDHFGQS